MEGVRRLRVVWGCEGLRRWWGCMWCAIMCSVRKRTVHGCGQCADSDENECRLIKNKRAIEIALASRLCDHSKLKTYNKVDVRRAIGITVKFTILVGKSKTRGILITGVVWLFTVFRNELTDFVI
jgi:hypothetical protein